MKVQVETWVVRKQDPDWLDATLAQLNIPSRSDQCFVRYEVVSFLELKATFGQKPIQAA